MFKNYCKEVSQGSSQNRSSNKGLEDSPVPSDLSSPKLSNASCTTCSKTNVSCRSAGEVCVEISWKRAFLRLGSSLFRRLASLARNFSMILLLFEQPSTTGEVLGGEDFIAFTCFQKERKLALQSAVPSFLLAMCLLAILFRAIILLLRFLQTKLFFLLLYYCTFIHADQTLFPIIIFVADKLLITV